MLSAREVQHIAKLARIGLTDEETLRFQKDLGSILEYFEVLREVDVSPIAPQVFGSLPQNVTRQDAAKAKNLQERKRLLEMAPDQKDGYVKVKSIL